MTIENLVVNLSGKVRRVKSKGIQYLVAPVRMIVPGVLNGSLGPLLYPPEEIKATFRKWNGVPLTNNHPSGSAMEAGHLIMGEVRNAGTDGADLIGEAWFNVEKTKKVNNDIYAALTQGQKIELSTGLGVDKEEAPADSVFNGEVYTHIARNFKPDHLAILIDSIGACSVKAGCGVFNEESKVDSEAEETLVPVSNSEEEEDSMKLKPEERTAIVNGLIANNCGCWTQDDTEVLNGFSDEKLTSLQESSVKNSEMKETLNAATKEFKTEDGTTLTFNVENKKWISKTPEKEVDKEGSVVNKHGQGMGDEPQTTDQWLASAPPEVREAVSNSMQIQNEAKEALVRRLIANVADADKHAKGESLMKRSLAELREIEALLPAPAAQNSSSGINWGAASGGSDRTVMNEFGSDEFIPETSLSFSNGK